MTVLTQLAVGVFAAIWLGELLGASPSAELAALLALTVSGAALAAATLHLGRPIHAYRAMKMWRRSWLSREVVLFGAFSHVAGVYVALLWFGWPGTALAGALTTTLGVAGVFASGCIYLVPSRPAWNTRGTVVRFMLTGALLGPLVTGAVGAGETTWLRAVSVGAAAVLLGLIAWSFRQYQRSPSIELRGTARLLSTRLSRPFLLRITLLVVGGVAVPALSGNQIDLGIAAMLTLVSELLGRYLFFVSVVPKHMTAPYLATGREAA
jgi:DMSO reductase anchor subunit